jgi:hypothetical protein
MGDEGSSYGLLEVLSHNLRGGTEKNTQNHNEVELLLTYLSYIIYRTPKCVDYYE